MWREFWDEWVPFATRGERYCIVHNGDAVEGDHHRVTTSISANPVVQGRIFTSLMEPEVEKAKGGFYLIRGTGAHVGESARAEEGLGKALGAIPNDDGQYARWELWKQVGDNKLVHFLHHVGTTSSQAYESTAVYKELIEMYVEAARWRLQPPDIAVRSHRHRNFHITVPAGTIDPKTGDTITSEASVLITPCWQLKTEYVWKAAGARTSMPQIGGISIRFSDDKVLYATSKVWSIERSRTE
jgi:hypothetical protein